eukprot:10332295-Heterocapsa_arctica.AAC.1
MSGKGRHHEGLASDPGNWLDGMSVKKTNMCRTIAEGVACPHFRSARGCGFAHSKEERQEAEVARTKYVRDALVARNWPWYMYHHLNQFAGDGTPTHGPALAHYQAGDLPYQEEDPLRSILK